MVEGAVGLFGRGPILPAIGLVDDGAIGLARERRLVRLLQLQIVKIFQEQHPGGLLGVVELGGAASLLPKDIVNILECLFEHAHPR
jgi:hypothetical protein